MTTATEPRANVRSRSFARPALWRVHGVDKSSGQPRAIEAYGLRADEAESWASTHGGVYVETARTELLRDPDHSGPSSAPTSPIAASAASASPMADPDRQRLELLCETIMSRRSRVPDMVLAGSIVATVFVGLPSAVWSALLFGGPEYALGVAGLWCVTLTCVSVWADTARASTLWSIRASLGLPNTHGYKGQPLPAPIERRPPSDPPA